MSEKQRVHSKNFIGRCGIGRGGETCKQCARKNRNMKRRASKQIRHAAKCQRNQVGKENA